jgi:hypothetical protein
MATDPEQAPRSRIERWEALPAIAQAGIVFPPIAGLLTAIHLTFFHRITTARSIGYAIGEGASVAGLVALASQNEKTARELRRQDEAQSPPEP